MTTLYRGVQVTNNDPILSSDGATDTVTVPGDFAIVAGIVANDVIELCGLPAGYVPVDAVLDAGDLESGTSLTFDVGILSGNFGVIDNARTCGAEFMAGSTVGQAGGIARASVAGCTKIAPTDNDRGIGLKVAALSNTNTLVPGATATVRLNVTMRPALNGV